MSSFGANYDGGVAHLNKCTSPETLSKFFHELITWMGGGRKPAYVAYQDVWSIEEWFHILKGCEEAISTAGSTVEEGQEFELTLEGVSEAVCTVLKSVLSLRRADVQRTVRRQALQTSECVLQDFDWQVKHSLGSDRISKLDRSCLTLDLFLTRNQQQRNVSVELELDELNQLISKLESANKAFMQMSE